MASKFFPCCGPSGDVRQIVMFGPKGSGKTTLLYRLKIQAWKTDSMSHTIDNLSRSDFGYHYEEFNHAVLGSYGIWDVPGSPAMVRMWPSFYRYVNISSCLFVVDGSFFHAKQLGEESWEETMMSTKLQLHRLLNEDELRMAAFFLIINTRGEAEHLAETVLDILAVQEIFDQPWNAPRFRVQVFDVCSIHASEKPWTGMMEEVYKIAMAHS